MTSFTDCGALLRVDGVFLNKDKDPFMDSSDTGYICEMARLDDGRKYIIDGNFYVYAGDEKLMLCFEDYLIFIISGDRVIKVIEATPFASETYTNINGIDELRISHLDKSQYPVYNYIQLDYYDYLDLHSAKSSWKMYKKFCRFLKSECRSRRKSYTLRFLVEWNYEGHHYEVIYGYGIDPSREGWDEIKTYGSFDFTDTECRIIDGWFDE